MYSLHKQRHNSTQQLNKLQASGGRVDLATVIGILGAMITIAAAIMTGGSPGFFFNIPSLLIVVAGSIFATMTKFGLKQYMSCIKVSLKAFIYRSESPEEIIAKVLELSNVARKNGLLALENVEIKNEFLKQGIQYMVDGLEPDVVRSTLQKEMYQTLDRHEKGQKIFRGLGDVAPAMGMIGTLVGLVQMLAMMDDPKTIGPSMAVAIITTLYGAVIANVIALPLADKLELRSQEEELSKLMIIDAVMGIQAGQNPRVIEELLKMYLPGTMRSEDDEGE